MLIIQALTGEMLRKRFLNANPQGVRGSEEFPAVFAIARAFVDALLVAAESGRVALKIGQKLAGENIGCYQGGPGAHAAYRDAARSVA